MKLRPNIIFIVIDALRAKNLGCYGYFKQTSPNIDNLAKDGILFENAFSCANATDPSLTTIFSGKYPRSHGIIKHAEGFKRESIQRFNESQTRFLPQILKADGYITLAVDWLGRWHKQGYDYYSGLSKNPRAKPLYWLMVESLKFKPLHKAISRFYKPTKFIENAEIITNKVMGLLNKIHDKKFFLFIHYWDTHYPYNPPAHFVECFRKYDYGKDIDTSDIINKFEPKYRATIRDRLINSTSLNEVLARYDAAIAFVDHCIGKLIQAFKDYEILDQSLIVLTSDHGESLTEHGIFFEHHGLYDVSINVPFILNYREFPTNKRIKSLVQHTDIVPTVINALGVRSRNFEFEGKSLVPLIQDGLNHLHSAIYVEEADAERKVAIRTNEYKYIYALSDKHITCRRCGVVHGGSEELYNLKKDPDETQNVHKENFEIASLLRKRLKSWMEFLEKKKTNKNRMESNKLEEEILYQDKEEKEIIERLRALGYL